MWLCLLLVFVCSYGVFRQALFFANKEPYWGVINDLFYKPYWHVYGELFVEQEGEQMSLLTWFNVTCTEQFQLSVVKPNAKHLQ